MWNYVFCPTIQIPEYYSGCQNTRIPNTEYYSVLRKSKYRIQILLFGLTIRIVFEYQIIRHTMCTLFLTEWQSHLDYYSVLKKSAQVQLFKAWEHFKVARGYGTICGSLGHIIFSFTQFYHSFYCLCWNTKLLSYTFFSLIYLFIFLYLYSILLYCLIFIFMTITFF